MRFSCTPVSGEPSAVVRWKARDSTPLGSEENILISEIFHYLKYSIILSLLHAREVAGTSTATRNSMIQKLLWQKAACTLTSNYCHYFISLLCVAVVQLNDICLKKKEKKKNRNNIAISRVFL